MSLQFKICITMEIFFIFGFFPFIAVQVNIYFNWPVILSIYNLIAGILFLFIGGMIIIKSAWDLFFKPDQEMVKPNQAPSKFIETGILRYVRNPMYLGYFCVVLSEFLIFGHIALLLYFFILIILVHLAVVYMEEPSLEVSFGSEYINYKKRVNRWIPKFRLK